MVCSFFYTTLNLLTLETKPQCNNCCRLKLECGYGTRLLWQDEAEERGIAFGRLKKVFKRVSKVPISNNSKNEVISLAEAQYFINVTCNDFSELNNDDKVPPFGQAEVAAKILSRIQLISSNSTSSVEPNIYRPTSSDYFSIVPPPLNQVEQTIFSYFVREMCPVCVCYPNQNIQIQAPQTNPYLNLIVPLCMKSELVFTIVLSVGAHQLDLLGHTEYKKHANESMRKVIRQLPSVIQQKQQTHDPQQWDEVLAVIVMLCFGDISLHCGNSWLVHLRGAKEFFHRRNLITASTSQMAKFFIDYFVTHEIMGETAWTSEGLVLVHEYNDVNIDLVMGCSPNLIMLISKILNLGQCYERLENLDGELRQTLEVLILQEGEKLQYEIENLQQFVRFESIDDSSADAIEQIKTIAEIKRLTTLVYLFARVDIEYFYFSKTNLATNKSFQAKWKQIKHITGQIISLSKTLPSSSMSLLWTFFVTGLTGVSTEEERYYVLHRLIEMERSRELASVKIARRVVESVWVEKDLNALKDLACDILRWKDMNKSRAGTISLA